MRRMSFTSAMVVPLVARGRTLGAITLVSAESGRRYDRADLELAEELARRAALAVDNARLYDEAQKEISERDRAETRFRTLVEQIPAVTYIQEPIESDNPKVVTYMSPQYETMLGYPREAEILDEEHWLRTLHPEDRERVLAEEVRTDESGEPFKIEYRVIAADDRVVWVRDHAVLMRDKEGQPLYWLGVQYDITEQKRVEAALRQSEELYRTVVEQAAENIFLVDVETKRVLEANAALRRSLGYTPEEFQDLTLYDIVAHDRQSVDQNTQRILEEGQRYLGERRYRRKDGSLVDVEVSASAIYYDGGEAMSVVAHDITERKKAEEALDDAREAERNRIARDLHDDILQDIVYALQEIQVAQITSENGGSEALEEAADALRRSVEGLRDAIFELRLKQTLGRSFVSSLENLMDLNRRMARSQYELDLVVADGFPSHFPERTGREIVRIIQEALTNARRHARPRRVLVRLWRDGDLARVEVADDGRGFDTDRAGIGVGQQSMRYRALELGGELTIESTPGGGTRVRFEVPVSRLLGEVRPGRGGQPSGDEGTSKA
jgi:PAS domain S-box-containing protein